VSTGGDGAASSRTVTARLVVAADGGNSAVKKAAGLPSWGWGYGRKAVVATVRVKAGTAAGPGGGTAWQRFLPDGPVALLPLWDDHASLVWSTTPQHAADLAALAPGAFVEALNAALRAAPASGDAAAADLGAGLPGPLGPAVAGALRGVAGLARTAAAASAQPFYLPPQVEALASGVFGFDLKLEQAARYAAPRVALVGDAAHSVHPMAGQGLNLGLADAKELVDRVAAAHMAGTDVGDHQAVLDKYAKTRAASNLALMAGIDGLHRLFTNTNPLVRWARGAGMQLLHGNELVKGLVEGVAAGGRR